MAKFRIKLSLQGLDLEIEGSREEAPLIAQSLTRQFSGLLQPATDIVDGNEVPSPRPQADLILTVPPPPASGGGRRGSRRRRNQAPTATADNGSDQPLDWVHDPAKWGMPRQSWNTANKAIWLLYVVSSELGQNELTARTIAATFNKHFKKANQILQHNVSRDLGKAKQKAGKNSPIAEDTTKEPPGWFLTDAGVAKAQNLVAEALNGEDTTQPTE